MAEKYIPLSAAVDEMKSWEQENKSYHPEDYEDEEQEEPGIPVLEVIERLNSIEPADVRPVVRGKWEPHPSNPEYDVCSACGTGTRKREYHHQGHVPGVTEFCYWFCPWCGADMRTEQRKEADNG